MVPRAGLRVWLGLKLMTVMAAVHLAFMASSQIKGKLAARHRRALFAVDAGFNVK